MTEQQTCGAPIGWQEFELPGARTSVSVQRCGQPIRGSGPCAAPVGYTPPCGRRPDDPLHGAEGHPYQPSIWEHVESAVPCESCGESPWAYNDHASHPVTVVDLGHRAQPIQEGART